MNHPKLLKFLSLILLWKCSCLDVSTSAVVEYMSSGSTISVERADDTIVSPDHTFSAGFRRVGENAFCFAIWFTKAADFTPVWMANRDQPVNGIGSSLSVQKDGNLALSDAGKSIIWAANTLSTSTVQLRLSNSGFSTGNLKLTNSTNVTLWQSFDSPTDTLLPQQPLHGIAKLIASQGKSNYSSGFYSFFFDNDNVLRLYYSRKEISSVYWPNPSQSSWKLGRANYNTSRIAMFDLFGHFQSTDKFSFLASDFGLGPKRRLTMDYDGNLRLYSLDGENGNWIISWQAISDVCSTIHGLCGPNSICLYGINGWSCSCPPGFKPKDQKDWSQGCESMFDLSCDPRESTFLALPEVDFYGYDYNYSTEVTLQYCEKKCLELCSCKAFLYHMKGTGICYLKIMLLNGYRSPSINSVTYIKVPINRTFSYNGQLKKRELICYNSEAPVILPRTYGKKQKKNSLTNLFWFVSAIGVTEVIFVVMGWWYLLKKSGGSLANEDGYNIATTGLKRFSYAELKMATRNFSEEIGRGGGGTVYKASLPDQRVAAIKCLKGVNQGEAEFLAEVSTIGRINHMNLMQLWGFCADRKHRLLVYEYMGNGSLAENLASNTLDWGKRFEIAVGTGKGLAYLHEECLEWILHCDVKPQNILLGDDYIPKVGDFGLSKLIVRRGLKDLSFSHIRGTRGYMAPEWILNQSITSKVDVYSYGIVLLEMVTGRRPLGFNFEGEGEGNEYGTLVTWVREKKGRIDEIMDPMVDGPYDEIKMELLVRVALQCVEDDKDARPTMAQVVDLLERHDYA